MVEWRPMTDLERLAAQTLSPSLVRYPVASPPKRLARSLAEQARADPSFITNAQAVAMWRMAHRFRRQVKDESVRQQAAFFATMEAMTKGYP